MTHLSHRLPWTVFCDNFQLRKVTCSRCRAGFSTHLSFERGCPYADLITRNKPEEEKQLLHFQRCLINAIKEFADTERAKCPPHILLPGSGFLLGEDFCDVYQAQYTPPASNHHGTEFNIQLQFRSEVKYARRLLSRPIEEWRASGDVDVEGLVAVHRTADVYAEAVKILLDADEISTLLALAQHEPTQDGLRTSLALGQSHQQGWKAVVKTALAAYLLINLVILFPEIAALGLPFKPMYTFHRCVLNHRDNCTEMLPHWLAWNVFVGGDIQDLHSYEISLFTHLDRQKEYLKKCFRLLYCAEMVAREVGCLLDWEVLIEGAMDLFVTRTSKEGFSRPIK